MFYHDSRINTMKFIVNGTESWEEMKVHYRIKWSTIG